MLVHERKEVQKMSPKARYRGISWHIRTKKWRAKITKEYRDIHLGNFTDPVEAALVRDAAERIVRGADAVLNFPKTPSSFEHRAFARGRIEASGKKHAKK